MLFHTLNKFWCFCLQRKGNVWWEWVEMYFLIIFYSWPFWGTESKATKNLQEKRDCIRGVVLRKNIVWGGFFSHGQWPSCLLLNSSTEMQCKDHFMFLRLVCSESTKISPLFWKTLAFLEILWWKFHQPRSWRAVLGDSGGRGVHHPPGITSGRAFQQGKSLMTPL